MGLREFYLEMGADNNLHVNGHPNGENGGEDQHDVHHVPSILKVLQLLLPVIVDQTSNL